MSAVECPICMDDINVTKNCIITECGHCFHSSCVMRNVAQNGFACPMCRTAMADDVESEETEYDDDDEFSLIVDQRNPDDYALRGFRMFMDNIHGVEHEREDELEEREGKDAGVEEGGEDGGGLDQDLLGDGVDDGGVDAGSGEDGGEHGAGDAAEAMGRDDVE